MIIFSLLHIIFLHRNGCTEGEIVGILIKRLGLYI